MGTGATLGRDQSPRSRSGEARYPSRSQEGPQIKACLDWLNAKKDSGGSFSPDPVSVQELHAVWTAAQLEKGQDILPGMEAKS